MGDSLEEKSIPKDDVSPVVTVVEAEKEKNEENSHNFASTKQIMEESGVAEEIVFAAEETEEENLRTEGVGDGEFFEEEKENNEIDNNFVEEKESPETTVASSNDVEIRNVEEEDVETKEMEDDKAEEEENNTKTINLNT